MHEVGSREYNARITHKHRISYLLDRYIDQYRNDYADVIRVRFAGLQEVITAIVKDAYKIDSIKERNILEQDLRDAQLHNNKILNEPLIVILAILATHDNEIERRIYEAFIPTSPHITMPKNGYSSDSSDYR